MLASALSDALTVAALAAGIGGVFTLLGVWIAAKIMRKDTRHEDDRTWRREQDEVWKQEVTTSLGKIKEDVTETRERLAGLEGVMRYFVPWESKSGNG